MKPLVSILMPVYNAGSYLRPALQSVLDQTYENLELVVIDDGSTDGCIELVRDLLRDERVQLIQRPNGGKPAALNQAMRTMRGDYFAIQDADDLCAPERVAKQVAALEANPDVAGVFVGCDLILGEKRMAPQFAAKTRAECRKDIEAMRMPGHDPTVMFRTSMAGEFAFEESLPGCEGFDHILRVGEQFPLLVLGECLYSYRINPGSVTRSNGERIGRMVGRVKSRAAERRGTHSSAEDTGAVLRKGGHRGAEHGVVSHFLESVVNLKQAGRLGEALLTAGQCLRLHATDPYYYKPLVFCLIPLGALENYRRWKQNHRHQQPVTA